MLTALHCVDSYLRTTENWLYTLIRHQDHTQRIVATDRFLDGDFPLPGVRRLRSPVQPRLSQASHITGTLRWRRVACRLTYPAYLRFALRDTRVDVVHSHFAQVGWRFRRTAKQLNAAHVVSFYGWDYVRLANNHPAWRARLQRLYREADCFLCEGPHGAALLASNGCPETKIRVAPLGVEVNKIPFFERTREPGKLRLLQLASFTEKKGHIDTIHAFAAALRERPAMHLTMIGASAGGVYDEVVDAIANLGIGEHVDVLPGVTVDRLHATMRDYGVFIHPSRHARNGDCEGGAPVVLLDAQATGMPVIATTHCDIPQEVSDGHTGILCAERDVAAIAAAIVRFCDMPNAAYGAFCNAAREHVARHFDARACAARVEGIYVDIATKRAEGRA